MKRRILVSWIVAMMLSVAAFAQMPEQYLDVTIARVKPEKRAEFDAVSKKVAEANRKNQGDKWIAMETTYGENNVVTFISTRGSYADVEKGFDAFMGALGKSFGPAASAKLFQDYNSTLASSRGEIRRRRWDLSANVSADAATGARMIGESRWIRTVRVRVRPGHAAKYEDFLMSLKAAEEKTSEKPAVLVSQAVAGQEGIVYYVSRLGKTLGDFDGGPTMKDLLGDEGFQNYLRVSAESVLGTETVINRFLPELSNPPAEYAAASPDFWTPKPKPAAKAKPKAEAAKPDAKEK
ncbi:MAG TPA: hypothetical protein VKV95_02025 [Terriglobia bacterium]|nr:hypothetical protein [Terriglobia bacterium]